MLKVDFKKLYGRLRIVRIVRKYGLLRRKVLAKCKCGTVKKVAWRDIKKKHALSCGCLKKELDKTFYLLNKRHGASWFDEGSGFMRCTPEYSAFHGAKSRCQNPKNKAYGGYGARGIQFLFASFEQFMQAV